MLWCLVGLGWNGYRGLQGCAKPHCHGCAAMLASPLCPASCPPLRTTLCSICRDDDPEEESRQKDRLIQVCLGLLPMSSH